MRPWRLTRRARVEMESALMALRHDVARRVIDHQHTAEGRWLVSGLGQPRRAPSDLRTQRARVALALRAALRADEDARCEEARFTAHTLAAEDHEPLRKFARPRVWGALDAIDALREWPQAALSPKGRVPRALWEVER